MNALLYFIIYQISRLPFPVMYFISDVFYVILYRLIGYRRGVIRKNLRRSFPDKSPHEIKQIHQQFYKNFCDYLVETLKSISITQQELDKRHTYSQLDVFNDVKSEHKNAMLMSGHVFNWEWYIGLNDHLPFPNTSAVYHRIKNPFWNDKINRMRSKFGSKAVEMREIIRFMMRAPKNGEMCYLFIADQSPKQDAIHYRIHFLNQDTPVFIGFDKISRRLDMAPIYCKTVKVKRGYYHTSFERIFPEGEKFQENEIVHQFFDKLEKTIHAHPDNWLWSHKRWKYANE